MRRECAKIRFDPALLKEGEVLHPSGKIVRPSKPFDKEYYSNMREEAKKKEYLEQKRALEENNKKDKYN